MDIKEQVQEIKKDLKEFKNNTNNELINIGKELAVYNEQLKLHIAGVEQNKESLMLTQSHMEKQHEMLRKDIELRERALEAKIEPVVTHVQGVQFTIQFIITAAKIIVALGVITGVLYTFFN